MTIFFVKNGLTSFEVAQLQNNFEKNSAWCFFLTTIFYFGRNPIEKKLFHFLLGRGGQNSCWNLQKSDTTFHWVLTCVYLSTQDKLSFMCAFWASLKFSYLCYFLEFNFWAEFWYLKDNNRRRRGRKLENCFVWTNGDTSPQLL